MRNPIPYKPILTWLLGSMLVACAAFGQDVHFSQFYEAPLLRNPALAGIFTGDYRIQGVYRDQWNSFTNAYRTGSFNGEYKMPVGQGNDYLTIGMQMFYDKAGTAGLTSSEIMPALNYSKSLSSEKPMYLSLGFMGGYADKYIDRSKITTNNQFSGAAFNPSLPDGESFATPDIHYWDASVGLSFNTAFGQNQQNSFFLGASYQHLNRPTNSFYQNASELDPKYVFSVGVKAAVDDYSYFTIQADHTVQGPDIETIGGVMYSYKLGDFVDNPKYTLSVGAFLRWQDAIIPVIKIDMYPISVGISYDINISSLQVASQGQGGTELSIVYIGFLDRDNSAKNKVLCPRF